MGSTRLPGKVMMEVLGRPLLAHMIGRLGRCRSLDGIVIAATNNPEDDRIADLTGGQGVFRGSEEDVLGRVLLAAQNYDVDVIVELTADCPLIDPYIVDATVRQFHELEPDFCWTVGYPVGMDVRVFPTEKLAEIDRLTDDPMDREHVSLHFWEHPTEFWIEAIAADPIHQDPIALAVDTPEDFTLIRQIFERLHPRFPAFGLSEILLLLNAHPELREINRGVSRKPVRQPILKGT